MRFQEQEIISSYNEGDVMFIIMTRVKWNWIAHEYSLQVDKEMHTQHNNNDLVEIENKISLLLVIYIR